MIIFCWCLTLCIVGAISEPLLSYQFVQFFPILVIWFYLLLQWHWHRIWPFIFVTGFMADVLLGHSTYFYLPFGLIVIPLVVNNWRRQGDCSIYLFNFVPLGIIAALASSLRCLLFLEGALSMQKVMFCFLYIVCSTVGCALLGCLQLYFYDFIARRLELPLLIDIRVRR